MCRVILLLSLLENKVPCKLNLFVCFIVHSKILCKFDSMPDLCAPQPAKPMYIKRTWIFIWISMLGTVLLNVLSRLKGTTWNDAATRRAAAALQVQSFHHIQAFINLYQSVHKRLRHIFLNTTTRPYTTHTRYSVISLYFTKQYYEIQYNIMKFSDFQ